VAIAPGILRPTVRASGEEAILRCVQFALQRAHAARAGQERRRERRHPFPYPVKLEPVGVADDELARPITVLGKHLSNHGLDFYCQQPLPYRRVIATFSFGQRQSIQMLMDLSWCRFSEHGWYENGGRFLSVVSRPAMVSPACT